MSKQANQAVFDAALKHIRKQGEPSMRNGKCAYRNDDGLGCAFSPSIERYHLELENLNSDEVIRRFDNRLYSWAKDVDPALASMVQRAHDNNYHHHDDFMARFEEYMRRIARAFGLNYSEV